MNITRSAFIRGASVTALALLAGCGSKGTDGAEGSGVANSAGGAAIATSLTFSNAAWQYDANDDVYYQLGVSYCETPADEAYEKLAVIVPAAYMKATDNGDGTFTCEVNKGAKVGSYTAETAPVVMPVNTPGYSAQSAMAEYTSQSTYTSQGIVYVHAGCRGRDHGAPAGVTDLKAAVRFLRAFAGQMPGDAERVFTFGHSGGGAQSALMGATGDAPEYEAYLKAIGAVEGASDAIFGSMDWCPITNLDTADEAYEWMMGCTRGDLSEGEQSVSNALAEAFATYINSAQIPNENGSALVLEQSSSGVYQAGTYYECVKSAIEESLNNFLADTSFPYDASSSLGMGGMGAPGGGAPSGEAPGGDAPGGGMPNGGAPSGEGPGGEALGGGAPSGEAMDGAPSGQNRDAGMGDGPGDGISRNSTASGVSISGTYDTAADYISALNANGEWVTYNANTNTATISSVEAFCVALKQASKSLGAFDQFDRGQGENTLFGERTTSLEKAGSRVTLMRRWRRF